MAQAMSSTTSTAAVNNCSGRRTSPTSNSLSGSRPTSHFDRSSIDTSGKRGEGRFELRRAPARWRHPVSAAPTTGTSSELPGVILIAVGVHAAFAPGKSKPAGMTPTTVWLMSLSLTIFPTIRRIRAEAGTPQLIADDDRRLAALLAIGRQEGPSHRRPDAERVEEFRGDAGHLEDDRIARARQVALVRREGGEMLERAVALRNCR